MAHFDDRPVLYAAGLGSGIQRRLVASTCVFSVLFSVAYFVGSVVQRQKIAILVLRNRRNSIRSAG